MRVNPSLLIFAVASLISAHMARAVVGDQNWDSRFVLAPGFDGEITSMVVVGSNLYVGGSFTKVLDVSAQGIAMWNGEQWSSLDGGVNGSIDTVVSDGTNLYVGGIFSQAGGFAATNVAKWDGSTWSPLGPGLSRTGIPAPTEVVALKIVGSDLVAAGSFNQAGDLEVVNIARWNGSEWSAMGNGLGTWQTWVESLEVFQTNLIAGGLFLNSGSAPVTNLASWNGSDWQPVGGGVSGSGWWVDTEAGIITGSALSLLSTPTGLLVGGEFFKGGGNSITNLAKWDGTNWWSVGEAADATVRRLLVDGTNILALGSFSQIGGVISRGTAAFDGVSWSPLGSGVVGHANAAVRIGTNLFVGGRFQLAGGKSAGFIARWDGHNWHSLFAGKCSAPFGSVYALASTPTGGVYVGGTFSSAGEVIAENIAEYDGTNWKPLGQGYPGGVSFLAVGGTNLYASSAYGGQPMRWDGTRWASLGSGISNGNHAPTISALVASESNLFVAGFFDRAGGSPITNFACWDEGNWSSLSYPGANPVAMTVRGNDLYVVNCENLIQVWKWDGMNWTTFAAPLQVGAQYQGYVSTVTFFGSNLYIGGQFIAENGVVATNLAQWNGLAWEGVDCPIGTNGLIRCLSASGTNLYVGGYSYVESDVSPPSLFKWDGSSWAELGSGIAGDGHQGLIYALATTGRTLYVGGEFMKAGGGAAANLALWHEFPNVTLVSRGWLSAGRFGLSILGSQNQAVRIQASTNLNVWTDLGVKTPDSNEYEFEDTNAFLNGLRFYRTLLVP